MTRGILVAVVAVIVVAAAGLGWWALTRAEPDGPPSPESGERRSATDSEAETLAAEVARLRARAREQDERIERLEEINHVATSA